MTNYLADELRQIAAELDAGIGTTLAHLPARHQLESLIQRVEKLGGQPVEVDASTDLTVTSGLEPEQEIRARAAEIIGSPSQLTVDSVERWRRTADAVADYIRDGSKRS